MRLSRPAGCRAVSGPRWPGRPPTAPDGSGSRGRDRDERREPTRSGGRCLGAVLPSLTGARVVRWRPAAVGWGTPRPPTKRPGLCNGAGPGTRPVPAAWPSDLLDPPAAEAASPRPGRCPPGWQGPAARCAMEWRDASCYHLCARCARGAGRRPWHEASSTSGDPICFPVDFAVPPYARWLKSQTTPRRRAAATAISF